LEFDLENSDVENVGVGFFRVLKAAVAATFFSLG
jgi:hypothetical protein